MCSPPNLEGFRKCFINPRAGRCQFPELGSDSTKVNTQLGMCLGTRWRHGKNCPASERDLNVLCWPALAVSCKSIKYISHNTKYPRRTPICVRHFKLVLTMRGFLYLGFSTALLASKTDYTKYVNLFIGTEGPDKRTAYSRRNVFPEPHPPSVP